MTTDERTKEDLALDYFTASLDQPVGPDGLIDLGEGVAHSVGVSAPSALRSVLEMVSTQRAATAKLVDELATARAEFEARHAAILAEHAALHERIKASKADLEVLEETAKTLAVEEYEVTGNKHPGPGIQVKLFTRLDYDPAAALRWAQENAKAFLVVSLAKAKFEAYAAKSFVPGVMRTEDPRAQWEGDLDIALKGATP